MLSVEKRRLAFLTLAAPFVLNDFLFVAFSGLYAAYLIDYSVRILVLIVCFTWPVSRQIVFEPSNFSLHFGWLLLAIIVLSVVGIYFDYYIGVLFFEFTGLRGLFVFGKIENENLYLLDLTFGLFLVALSEELVFRKLASSWLREVGRPAIQIVCVSAIFFSLAHWGSGLGSMLSTFLIGCLFMAAYLKIGRLWPLVTAHWIIDFSAFGLGY